MAREKYDPEQHELVPPQPQGLVELSRIDKASIALGIGAGLSAVRGNAKLGLGLALASAGSLVLSRMQENGTLGKLLKTAVEIREALTTDSLEDDGPLARYHERHRPR